MGSTWSVQPVGLLALGVWHQNGKNELRVAPFLQRCKNRCLWNALWLIFVCRTLWVIIFPFFFPPPPSKERHNNPTLEGRSEKVKLRNDEQHELETCISITNNFKSRWCELDCGSILPFFLSWKPVVAPPTPEASYPPSVTPLRATGGPSVMVCR